jgi:hypothetical protein
VTLPFELREKLSAQFLDGKPVEALACLVAAMRIDDDRTVKEFGEALDFFIQLWFMFNQRGHATLQ